MCAGAHVSAWVCVCVYVRVCVCVLWMALQDKILHYRNTYYYQYEIGGQHITEDPDIVSGLCDRRA